MRSAPSSGQVRPPRLKGAEGFTLIEVLVAFVILAVFVVVLQRGVVGTVDGAERARSRVEAIRVASTLVAIPDPAGTPASGRLDGHDWRVRFEPIAIPAGTGGEGAAVSFRPMRMIVEVAAGRGTPIRVETVRLVRATGGGAS